MHYANGREAKNGDKIMFLSYTGPVVGILYDAKANNDYCNGKIAVASSNDAMPNLKDCLHIDDVIARVGIKKDSLAAKPGEKAALHTP